MDYLFSDENVARHDDSTSQCRPPTSSDEGNEGMHCSVKIGITVFFSFYILAFFSQLSDSSLSDDTENIGNTSKSHDIFEVGILPVSMQAKFHICNYE